MPDNQDNQSGSTPAPSKAQAEFDKYKARAQAGASAGGSTHPDGPSWAVPPSVTMLPRYVEGAASAASGSLADSIGTTLRLGLDVINAALSGGARILGGFGGAYGHEDCGCESCCEPSCCEPDCCGCECCHPGVGNCC